MAPIPDSPLPLPPHAFLVLLTLNEAPRHGYGIKKDVAERSDGMVDLDAGGLYRLIARMEERGWVEPTDEPHEHGDGDGGRRKYYALTAFGRAVLAAEARRMAGLVGSPDVRSLLAGDAPA